MQSLLAFVILATSLHATAAIVKTNCNFADYDSINSALSTLPVLKGENLKSEVQSVLQQEMGPVCKRVMDTVPRMGIPGRRTNQYELTAGGVIYTISIGRQVEARPTQWVSIYKSKATR